MSSSDFVIGTFIACFQCRRCKIAFIKFSSILNHQIGLGESHFYDVQEIFYSENFFSNFLQMVFSVIFLSVGLTNLLSKKHLQNLNNSINCLIDSKVSLYDEIVFKIDQQSIPLCRILRRRMGIRGFLTLFR